MNVAAPLAWHARNRADHPAIILGERVVDYRELECRVRGRAGHLYARGLAPGDAVALALADGIEHLALMMALARAGLVMIPVDWRWTPEEQARVARHFGARLAITEPGAAALEGLACVAVDALGEAEPDRPFPEQDGPLLMSLSSGTTGRPKGPLLAHSQFLARFRVSWVNLGFNAQDRYVSATPLYFGGGRTFAMMMLHTGGTVILFPQPYTPEALCAEIARHDATSIFLVPTLLRRLLELPDTTLAPLKRLKLLLSSGSALHPDERRVVRARMCEGLVEYYSCTEGGGISYLTKDDPPQFGESVGRPVFAVEVQCVGEDHRSLAAGGIGRIRFRGPAVAASFWNDPDASADAFRDGWYYPGDLGMMDEHGYLYLRGRAKDMIIRGGVNIYPADVEAVLLAHPAVTDAAVVGWPARAMGEEVAAFVIVRAAVSPEELRALCRARLAPYKVPREVFVVNELPRNTLGKVIKSALRDRLPPLS